MGGEPPPEDNEYPQFTLNFTSPNTGASWTFDNINYFNVTIDKSNNTQGIEFNNVNYTLTNTTTIEFTKALEDLSAGTYSYYLWAYGNGTDENYNWTGTSSYELLKIDSGANMNAVSNGPVTYPNEVLFVNV